MTYNEISVLTMTIISVTGDTLKQSDLTLHHSLGYDCTRLSLGQEDQWSDPSGWIIFKIKLLGHDARPSGGTTYTWWTAARFSMLLETSSTFSTQTPINWGRCHYTLLRIIYITDNTNWKQSHMHFLCNFLSDSDTKEKTNTSSLVPCNQCNIINHI